MNKFAECFNDYLRKYHVSFKRAAFLCDMDRTLLRRYARGDRTPKSEEIIRKIAAGLSMNHTEEEALCKAYRRSKIGERQYRMNEVLDKIRVCERKNPPRKQEYHVEEIMAADSVKQLRGASEILWYIKKIIWHAQYLKLSLNPYYPEIFSILEASLVQNPYCKAEHIMEMSSFYDKDSIEDVMSFETVFPLLLTAENYRIFHHYRWDGIAEAEKSNLNLCMSDKGMVLFDLEKKHGLFSNQKCYLEYFGESFEQQKKHCSLFAETMSIGKTEDEILLQSGKIMLMARSGGKESIFIRKAGKDGVESKGIFLEEEGIVYLIKNYLM